MKISTIFYSQRFLRNARKLVPELQARLIEREKIFRADCFDPGLKTHKLSGKLKKYWSFSITHSYRVLFEFLGTGKTGFIDIGNHSIYQ